MQTSEQANISGCFECKKMNANTWPCNIRSALNSTLYKMNNWLLSSYFQFSFLFVAASLSWAHIVFRMNRNQQPGVEFRITFHLQWWLTTAVISCIHGLYSCQRYDDGTKHYYYRAARNEHTQRERARERRKKWEIIWKMRCKFYPHYKLHMYGIIHNSRCILRHTKSTTESKMCWIRFEYGIFTVTPPKQTQLAEKIFMTLLWGDFNSFPFSGVHMSPHRIWNHIQFA